MLVITVLLVALAFLVVHVNMVSWQGRAFWWLFTVASLVLLPPSGRLVGPIFVVVLLAGYKSYMNRKSEEKGPEA